MIQYDTEVRWGDQRDLTLAIPAATTALQASKSEQIINVNESARVWAIVCMLEWLDRADGLPSEVLTADIFIHSGIGSAIVSTYRGLSVGQAAPLNIADVVLDAWPAGRLFIDARLRVDAPVSGAARVYTGRVGFVVAPYVRADLREE